jgi:glycosyltransferase involved in cell wall biosynthesis
MTRGFFSLKIKTSPRAAWGPLNRYEQAATKLFGYPIFWSSKLRQAVRFRALQVARPVLTFLFDDRRKVVRRTIGERQVERRVAVLGCPVYVKRLPRPKYRVALLVDEFFGGWETPIGGYGALARKYICRHVSNDKIDIDVLLGETEQGVVAERVVDGTRLFRLPASQLERQRWLDAQVYDLFVSIEMTAPSFGLLSSYRSDTPLLYLIQDPRDLQLFEPRRVSVSRLRDDDWSYIRDVSKWIGSLIPAGRVSFLSQGDSLADIARRMYDIPASVPTPKVPNPVEIDAEYVLNTPPKTQSVVFLGRLEAQKRVWIVCEIARAMPQYEFYVLGAIGKGRNERENARALEQYRNADGSSRIPNLHFLGHVDGEVKQEFLKTARILINTSIWEGIPISWIEALACGTIIVSAFDRDDIVSRFGTYIGEVAGDGTDPQSIGRFVEAIDYWMKNEVAFNKTAAAGIEYVRHEHSIPVFAKRMQSEIIRLIERPESG